MTSPMVFRLIDRASTLRRRLDEERRRPDACATHLLRLQAMSLRLQHRLATALDLRSSAVTAIRVAAPRRRQSSLAH